MSKQTDDHGSEHQTMVEAPTHIMEVELDRVVGAMTGQRQNPIGTSNTNQVSTQAGTLTIFDWYGDD